MKRFKDYSTNYLDRLGNLLKQIDFGMLEKIAGEIVRAYQEDRTVYVAGNGGSASTATHMSCDLSKGTVSPIHRRLRVTSLNDNMAWFSAIANDFAYEDVFVEQLRTILRKGDVLIAISFRRGLRQTVEGLLQARLKKAYCVGITDSVLSPIARKSDQYFLASIESVSYGGSYVSPMALLDVIIVACAHYRPKRTLRILKEADCEQRTGSRWYGQEK